MIRNLRMIKPKLGEDMNCMRLRRILAKGRGGTAALRLETDGWKGLGRKEGLVL